MIYAPGNYAKTDELIAITKAAGEFGGAYISHMRSEGDRFLEAVDELIGIARAAKVPAEIHDLKAAGEKNWPKMAQAIARVEAARAQGRARFEQFIEQLGRHLLRGRSLVKDVYEEIQPEDSQFFGLGDPLGSATGDDRPAAGSKPEAAS